MIDQLLAFKILMMLVKPFNETKAFELGIIDETGRLLIRPSEFKTSEQKEAYNILNRLVFNLKRIINRTPGGESKLKNITAAYFLVKENMDCNVDEVELELEFNAILRADAVLVEETIDVLRFLRLYEDAPANATGAAVATDEPVVNRKRKRKVEPHAVQQF